MKKTIETDLEKEWSMMKHCKDFKTRKEKVGHRCSEKSVSGHTTMHIEI